MKRNVLTIILLAVALMACAKKKQVAQDDVMGKGTGKVYVFGVSQMLTDSVVYITNISEVDSIDLAKKTKFLPYRAEFSLQLKIYLEGTLGLKQQTACVFYSTERKKLTKKHYKIKKRYLDNPNTKIFVIDDQRFTFTHPLDAFSTKHRSK